MPAGDGTGPMGQGPMTGRAAGYCAGYGVPGYMNPIPGRGFGYGFGRGWGRGRGRGWGRGFGGMGQMGYGPDYGVAYPGPLAYGNPVSPQQEAEALKTQAEQVEATLAGIRKRLDEIEAQQTQ